MNNSKHRLLYLVGQLGGGGYERQLWYLVSALKDVGFQPGVIAWNFDPNAFYANKLKEHGIPVYPIERRGGYLLRLNRLRKLVHEIKPEVLHSYSTYTNFPVYWAMYGRYGITLGSLRNDYWVERKQLGVVGAIISMKFPQTLIANSSKTQQDAMSHRSWLAPKNVFLVPNAIDIDLYKATPPPENSNFEILGIGRLAQQKNWKWLLHVMAKFTECATIPWRLRICGKGPLLYELESNVRELDLENHIEFLGFSEDVPSIIASSHVLVLTSDYEGTPNVVLEAMASQRPVIATAVGDVPRLIQDGVEGYVVSVGDIELFTDRLIRLATNRALAQRMGKAGRKRVETEWTPVAMMQATLAVYREVGWTGQSD